MPDIRAWFASLFDLTEAEQAQARDAAGQPWRTGYYVASRDWPVPPDGGPTLAEAYAAAETMRTQEVPNGA